MAEQILGSIEHLRDKILSWTSTTAISLHGDEEKAYPKKAEYIWEEANTNTVGGFVHYGPKFAAYYSANGNEYVLTSEFDTAQFDIDWKANKFLYAKSTIPNSNFKMVNPIGVSLGKYNTIKINDSVFVYYRLQHPDTILGSNHMFSESPETRIKMFVDNITTLLENIKEIKDSQNIQGYPSIKTPWLMTNGVSLYWRFLYQWKIPAEGCLARLIGELQKYIQTEQKNGIIVADNLEQYARDSWKKALDI
jgi:hypothetical protein